MTGIRPEAYAILQLRARAYVSAIYIKAHDDISCFSMFRAQCAAYTMAIEELFDIWEIPYYCGQVEDLTMEIIKADPELAAEYHMYYRYYNQFRWDLSRQKEATSS